VYEGIELFARDRFRELVPAAEMRRQMESIHQVCFTSTTLTTLQKISANAANGKISSWKQSGAVVQIGDIMMNRTGKPNRLYAFSDPRISFSAAGIGVQAFIEQKMDRCAHCSAIQVRDWEIGTQHGNCTNCHSLLQSEGVPEWAPSSSLLRTVRRELTALLSDPSYVKLLTDDLGFSLEELEGENFASVEMMWKWLINVSIDSGPQKVLDLVDEVMERLDQDAQAGGLVQLRVEATQQIT
jgi:hypothetical protein